jgi:hypothetical protein
MNALIDLNVQLAINNWTGKADINWASVGVSFATGMLGFGLAQRAATAGTLAARVAGNQLLQRTVDTGIDGLGKIAENAITGKAWHTELPETLAGNFILGSAADGIGKLGKHLATSAWDKHGDSISAGVKHLDNLAGNTLHQIDRGIDRGLDNLSDRLGGSQSRLVPALVDGDYPSTSAKPISEIVGDGFRRVMAMADGSRHKLTEGVNDLPTRLDSGINNPKGLTSEDFGFTPRTLDITDDNAMAQAYNLSGDVKRAYGELTRVVRPDKPLDRRGPVFSGVSYVDGDISITRTAFNANPKSKSVPYVHPLFKARLNTYTNKGVSKNLEEELLLGMGKPGSHAEVFAASKVLRRIEVMNPGLKITEDNAEQYLSKMMIYNVRLKSSPGENILRCSNCQVLTRGILSLSDLPEQW